MRHNLHSYVSHLTNLTLEGLSPQAKADIENYIRERRVDESGDGVWGFIKWAAIVALVVCLIICLIYFIYQWCKNKAAGFQDNPMMPGMPAGYGGYQPNYPVMAGAGGMQGMGYGGVPGGMGAMGAMGGMGGMGAMAGYEKPRKNPRGREANFA